MPALPNVPAVVRMRLQFKVGADLDVLPHSYWQYSGSAPTTTQLGTMASGLFTSLTTPFEGLLISTSAFTGVELVDLSSPTSATGSHFGSAVGTRSGTELPASTAADIAFTIARRYRGGKPHTEMPFGSASDLQTPQDWTASFVSAVNTGWGDVVAAMTTNIWSGGGSLTQVSVSYYGPPNRTVTSSTGRVRTVSTTRSTPLIDTVLSYGCQTRLGTVRRRLGKAA